MRKRDGILQMKDLGWRTAKDRNYYMLFHITSLRLSIFIGLQLLYLIPRTPYAPLLIWSPNADPGSPENRFIINNQIINAFLKHGETEKMNLFLTANQYQ